MLGSQQSTESPAGNGTLTPGGESHGHEHEQAVGPTGRPSIGTCVMGQDGRQFGDFPEAASLRTDLARDISGVPASTKLLCS